MLPISKQPTHANFVHQQVIKAQPIAYDYLHQRSEHRKQRMLRPQLIASRLFSSLEISAIGVSQFTVEQFVLVIFLKHSDLLLKRRNAFFDVVICAT
jgi:hypothetical protein